MPQESGGPGLIGIATGLVPIFYLWQIYRGFARKSLVSPWLRISLLLLWLVQWPIFIYYAMSHYGEDGRDKAVIPIVTLIEVGMIVYNFGPVIWLWHRAAASRRSD